MKEIARKTRERDGMTFRVTDDLPTCGHYYTIEYAKPCGDFLVWFRQTPSEIETLEEALRMLDEITND